MANRLIYPNSLYPLTGDVVSTAGAAKVSVAGLQNIPISNALPSDGDVLTYVAADGQWEPGTGSSSGSSVAPVQVATTTVLPDSPTYGNGTSGVGATLTAGSNAVLIVDGYTPALADRILVKNQASGFENGIYSVTQLGTVSVPYILTRTVDYDTAVQMNAAAAIPVINGTANGVTEWVLTDIITTIGTDSLVYEQFTLNPATIVTSVTASYPLASSGGTTPNLTLNPLLGFVMNDGSTGTNVGPMLTARQAGQVIKCVIVVKASDGSTDLTFKIKQNGTDVFSSDPTITHGTASGTVITSTSLTTVPLSVAANDVFSIDITTGTSSWKFTAQLE